MANNELPKYGFIPWARKGLGTMIQDLDAINSSATVGRPNIKITAEITDGGTTVLGPGIEKEVNLVGPGDIIGFNTSSIIKNEPAVGRLNNFERNYFPYVEFYEEDFPWRFSPGKSVDNKLTPWFTLVVLKDDGSEFEKSTEVIGHFPSIKILDEDRLPNPNDLWAWAHVQYTGDLLPGVLHSGGVDNNSAQANLTAALSQNQDSACSRILCPRLLEPNTKYVGFLIPTYEAGRRAGLGDYDGLELINAQQSSYQSGNAKEGLNPDLFPVYFQWEFLTGAIGDFEELVRLLKPQVPDKKVGRRPMYIGKPGFDVLNDLDSKDNITLGLEGALQVPLLERVNFPWPDSSAYINKLSQFINLSEDLTEATFSDSNHYIKQVLNPSGDPQQEVKDDPIITADIYGRNHVLADRVSPIFTTWMSELNLDPRNRAIAGLGAEYIKQNQESLVDRAWEQLGDVIEANKKIEWGQLAVEASKRGYGKNIATLPEEKQIAMMSGVLSRVKLSEGNLSALGKLNSSVLPNASISSAYRKIERPNGPLMKRIVKKKSTQIRSSLASKRSKLTVVKKVSSQLASIAITTLDSQISSVQTETVRTKSSHLNLRVAEGIDAKLSAVGSVKLTQSYSNFNNYFKPSNWSGEIERENIDLSKFNDDIKAVVHPAISIPLAIMSPISFVFADFELLQDKLVPIMAHPVYKEPVYEHVVSLGKEYLLPNLHLIPDNSITLMETNQKFIESFMVGLNHEMGKELLWRGYPTDQRGSYFRQFWNVADIPLPAGMTEAEFSELNYDISEIHRWPRTNELGHNDDLPIGDNDDSSDTNNEQNSVSNLVLVIRGELLRKYPNVLIYAKKGEWHNDARRPIESDADENYRFPIFKAEIDPDVYLIGFELDAEEAKGSTEIEHALPGWFFVLQERPGEVRFGMDESEPRSDDPDKQSDPREHLDPGEDPVEWNDLNLTLKSKISNNDYLTTQYDGGQLDLPLSKPSDEDLADDPTLDPIQFDWGENSAIMAQILYQNPVMVCIHADDMLTQN